MSSRQLKLSQKQKSAQPKPKPAAPSAAGPHDNPDWKHPAELIYSSGKFWTDKKLLYYCILNTLSISSPSHSPAPDLCSISDGRKTVVISEQYRAAISFASRWQWAKLQLLLTVTTDEEQERRRKARWAEEKYEVLHIARVWKILTDEGPLADSLSSGYGKQQRLDKIRNIRNWRCHTLDRVLTRFRMGCFSSEPSKVEKFWSEYQESEYRKDVFDFDWRTWVSQPHDGLGVLLSSSELNSDLDPERLMRGLREKDGRWFWETPNSESSTPDANTAWSLRPAAAALFSRAGKAASGQSPSASVAAKPSPKSSGAKSTPSQKLTLKSSLSITTPADSSPSQAQTPPRARRGALNSTCASWPSSPTSSTASQLAQSTSTASIPTPASTGTIESTHTTSIPTSTYKSAQLSSILSTPTPVPVSNIAAIPDPATIATLTNSNDPNFTATMFIPKTAPSSPTQTTLTEPNPLLFSPPKHSESESISVPLSIRPKSQTPKSVQQENNNQSIPTPVESTNIAAAKQLQQPSKNDGDESSGISRTPSKEQESPPPAPSVVPPQRSKATARAMLLNRSVSEPDDTTSPTLQQQKPDHYPMTNGAKPSEAVVSRPSPAQTAPAVNWILSDTDGILRLSPAQDQTDSAKQASSSTRIPTPSPTPSLSLDHSLPSPTVSTSSIIDATVASSTSDPTSDSHSRVPIPLPTPAFNSQQPMGITIPRRNTGTGVSSSSSSTRPAITASSPSTIIAVAPTHGTQIVKPVLSQVSSTPTPTLHLTAKTSVPITSSSAVSVDMEIDHDGPRPATPTSPIYAKSVSLPRMKRTGSPLEKPGPTKTPTTEASRHTSPAYMEIQPAGLGYPPSASPEYSPVTYPTPSTAVPSMSASASTGESSVSLNQSRQSSSSRSQSFVPPLPLQHLLGSISSTNDVDMTPKIEDEGDSDSLLFSRRGLSSHPLAHLLGEHKNIS